MNELIKTLVEWLKNNRIAKEGLLVAAVLAVIYSALEYVLKNPVAANILQDYRLQSATSMVISFWVASLCWRYAKYPLLRLTAATMFVILGSGGAVWIVMQSKIEQVTLRIVFDESVTISPTAIIKLVDTLQSPLFAVEIQDQAIATNTVNNESITGQEARNALNAHGFLNQGSGGKKSFTILVTGKNLSNSEWSNLLLIAWPEASVVSIWGVGQSTDISEQSVRRYIATSATLETLVSSALRYNKSILDKRSPTLYKGCLHDFHRTRQTYINQSQNPKFCDLEEDAIENIFGKATLKAANDVFSKISTEN